MTENEIAESRRLDDISAKKRGIYSQTVTIDRSTISSYNPSTNSKTAPLREGILLIENPFTGAKFPLETTTYGFKRQLLNNRHEILASGMNALKTLETAIGGFSFQYLIFAGILDTTLTSIDCVHSLIEDGLFDGIPVHSRRVLDAYLLYDGIFYARNRDQYMDRIRKKKRVSDLKSICSSNLSYTHIADISGVKNRLVPELFQKLSDQCHFSLTSLQVPVWNSGVAPSKDNGTVDIAIGAGRRHIDDQSLQSFTDFLMVLEYSDHMGQPLNDDQILEAKKVTSRKKKERRASR